MGERDQREGALEQVDDQWQLRFVRRLAHPRERVWRALTEEAQLKAWFPTTIEGELRPGAPLQFRFREGEFPPERGMVIACEPPSLLEFVWYAPQDGSQGDETTRFELVEDGDGCTLVFTTRYDTVGKSARDAAGWHVCLDALELALAGASTKGYGEGRWAPLREAYAARFGPEAATIGPPPGLSDR